MKHALAVVLALVATAHADSPKLGDARRALDELRYDEAQRLLLAAIHDGNNSAAAMRELYQLSAEAAAMLGHADLAQTYDMRWLALAPDAQLPASRSPKLREPFVAAQAYMVAHGAIAIRATRSDGGHVELTVVADPLTMVRTACELTGATSPIDNHGRAQLATTATRVAVCDENANRLVEVDVTTPPPAAPVAAPIATPVQAPLPAPAPPAEIPISHRWTTWGIPTLITGVAGLICLGYALQAQSDLDAGTETSTRTRNGLIIGASVSGALMIGFGIPTTILYLDQHARVVPTPMRGGAGVSIILPF
ncbi:MAG: hypothetical protein ABI678_13300 [Kofleriaceae bacterium]